MARFRLRRLWRVNCEALVIATGQNLKRLLQKRGWRRRPFPSEAVTVVPPGHCREEEPLDIKGNQLRRKISVALKSAPALTSILCGHTHEPVFSAYHRPHAFYISSLGHPRFSFLPFLLMFTSTAHFVS